MAKISRYENGKLIGYYDPETKEMFNAQGSYIRNNPFDNNEGMYNFWGNTWNEVKKTNRSTPSHNNTNNWANNNFENDNKYNDINYDYIEYTDYSPEGIAGRKLSDKIYSELYKHKNLISLMNVLCVFLVSTSITLWLVYLYRIGTGWGTSSGLVLIGIFIIVPGLILSRQYHQIFNRIRIANNINSYVRSSTDYNFCPIGRIETEKNHLIKTVTWHIIVILITYSLIFHMIKCFK